MKKLYNLKAPRLLSSAFTKKLLFTGLLLVISITSIAQTAYCVPAPTSVDGIGITNVTIGAINNTTTDEEGNYGNYTAQTVTVGQTVVQPFSITFSTGYEYNTKIWIDWNNDFDFNDAGEEVFSGTSSSDNPATITGTFTVPVTASLGNHRLRIGGVYGDTATPCYDFSYGSYEDYTLVVTTPPSCITPTNAIGTTTAPGSATLSWTAPAIGNAPEGYEYVVSTNNALPTGSGTPTTATTATASIDNGVFYYLHVRANCGDGDYSQWITSERFIYILGDTCSTALNLQTLTSPYTSSTIGANNDYSNSCNDTRGADIFYAIEVPLGYVLNIEQTDSDYDSVHTIFYGNCNTGTTLECIGYGNSGTVWENTTLGTQTVYWVQTGNFGSTGTFTLDWSLTAPPACNIPRNVTGTMTSLTTADVNWTLPVTGNPTGYEYAVTQTETPPESGTLITGLSVSGVTTVANAYNYVHVRTNCGSDGFSDWVTYAFYSGHCMPNSSFLNFYNIISFNTSDSSGTDIANNTAQTQAYTNNFNTMAVSQLPGNHFVYTAQVDDFTSLGIWVDWNNDLDFSDEGELVASHSYQGVTEIYTGTITIPAATAPGNYRMRVRSRNTVGTNPCSTYEYGTAQDYAVTVGNPPLCFNPVNLSAVASAQGTANLSWDAESLGTTPEGYEYTITTTATAPESGTFTTTTTIQDYPGLTVGTYYYLHVRTSCGNGNYSQWVTSLKFRYFEGDTCDTAINLAAFTSPYTHTTVGAANDYTPACDSFVFAPDLFYYIEVPNGYTLVAQLDSSDYNSNYSLFYGNCISQTPIVCLQSGGFPVPWENITGSAQNVYWVQDGGNNSEGTFTISWHLLPPAACDKPRTLNANPTSITSATVSWALPNTGAPAGYEYAVTQSATPPESGTFTNVRLATVTNVAANANNYLHVRSICGEDGNSVWETITFFSGYCIPENTQEAYYITSVSTSGAETNFSSNDNSFNAYTDYTAQYAVTSYPGGTFNMQATAPVTTDTYLYSVWIDWNNNFDFTDAGERVISTVTLASPANLGSITIPAQTPLGSYRMRIRNLYTGSPVNSCGLGLGEAEDYIINIVATPSCLPPFNPSVTPTDAGYANLNWNAPQLGGAPTGYEYVFSTSSTPPTGSGTPSASFFVGDAPYDPAQSVYLFVRSVCGDGDYSTWATMNILGANTPQLLSNSIIVYKETGGITITSANTVITGVTIYDTRGRKLYSQSDINNSKTEITGLQVQQQVLIVEVTTTAGKVSKRIVY
ncbi:hypothetical protein Q765_20670 [Flavobacterium rivuli WB 3.3-2 = DSM 21788]|uniref:Fibronectin type-III domain-containing protein n=1 Tax=Flavobacterium rivuli WB 3.3-2 = DSM 21788 TaxID=1121895 RepID=A0A0A2LXA2_9FLAO|nr:GEVED domain-containing protein [Flavobacterium rivuli]KGO84614.1 hypothetical protein Q765_20670 [Flavobacterium rivuli WB 3.3-2 = DSM 21788]